MKKYISRIISKFFQKSKYSTSFFNNYSEYIKIQYRCAPKEFIDSRLKIVSSFLLIIPLLEKHGISKPVTYKEDIIKGHLRENKISILDSGSRDGWTIEFLNSLGYSNVLGVELLEEYANYCNKVGRNVIHGDLHNLKFENESYDFVYCRHVLEHCLDPIAVLNELIRVTKIGGALYCSFPLEHQVFGKHTTAIPSLKAVREILNKTRYSFNTIYVGMAKDTFLVIPEGDEAIVFIIKKSPKIKEKIL